MEFMQILEVSCDSILPIIQFVKNGIIPIIQIGIPIILIIMGTIDLGKAVVGSDEKKIKEAQSTLVKRAIAAVAVFFVTTLVVLVFGLFADSGASTNENVTGTGSWLECWDEA